MKKQIVRFSVKQTSKIMAIMYFLFGILFSLLMLVMTIIRGGFRFSSLIVPAIIPFAYALFAFVCMAVMLALYNKFAEYFGGIEYYTEEVSEESSAG